MVRATLGASGAWPSFDERGCVACVAVSSLYYRSICSERLGNATQALKDINKALKLDNMNQQIVKRRRYLMHVLSTGRK